MLDFNKATYRVHYGNGQYSRVFEHLAEVMAEYKADEEWSRRHKQRSPKRSIQRLDDDGVWKPVYPSRTRETL